MISRPFILYCFQGKTMSEKQNKAPAPSDKPVKPKQDKEVGGPKGPEPTRYGDWESGGIASDF